MNDVRLFTLAEVAEQTGLSERALADAARAGAVPHYRLHGKRYMSLTQIEDYLASALVRPAKADQAPSLSDLIAAEAPRRSRR